MFKRKIKYSILVLIKLKIGGINMEHYIIFSIDGQEYGIDILDIKEVGNFSNFTFIPMPFLPKEYIGLINFRGEIISVLDMREKLNQTIDLGENEIDEIIIIEKENKSLAIIVDKIISISGLDKRKISQNNEEISEHSPILLSNFFKKYNGKLIYIIDAKQLLITSARKII